MPVADSAKPQPKSPRSGRSGPSRPGGRQTGRKRSKRAAAVEPVPPERGPATDQASSSVEDLLRIQRDLALFLVQAHDLDQVLARVFDDILRVTGAYAGGIYLARLEAGGVDLVHHAGLSETFVHAVRRVPSDDRRLPVLMKGEVIYELPPDEICLREGIQHLCVFPVLHQGELMGCINIAFKRDRRLSLPVRQTAEAIALQLGGVLARLRAEKAQQESERRYRAQFQRFPLPGYVWKRAGEDFTLIGCNRMAEEETRGKVNEIMGAGAREFYAHRADILDAMQEAFARQTTVHHEIPYRFLHSGEMRLISVTYTYAPPDLVAVYVEDITEQHQAATELRAANERLRREQQALEAKNIAMQEVLSQIEESKAKIGASLRANVEHRIMPVITRLAEETGETGKEYVQLLQTALDDLTSPFTSEMEERFASLTPRELQVCALIRSGSGSKDIARFLGVGTETVRSQRKSIRRKLGIAGGKVNLRTFLREFAPSRAISGGAG